MSQPTPTQTQDTPAAPPMDASERDIYAVAEAVGGTVYGGEE